MRGWLVGCQLKNQVFLLGKVFVPQTVVRYKFVVNFLFAAKNKGGETRIALDFPYLQGREHEFSGFITSRK